MRIAVDVTKHPVVASATDSLFLLGSRDIAGAF